MTALPIFLRRLVKYLDVQPPEPETLDLLYEAQELLDTQNADPTVPVPQAARLLRRPYQTISAAYQRGHIKGKKIGGRVLLDADSLQQWAFNHPKEATP